MGDTYLNELQQVDIKEGLLNSIANSLSRLGNTPQEIEQIMNGTSDLDMGLNGLNIRELATILDKCEELEKDNLLGEIKSDLDASECGAQTNGYILSQLKNTNLTKLYNIRNTLGQLTSKDEKLALIGTLINQAQTQNKPPKPMPDELLLVTLDSLRTRKEYLINRIEAISNVLDSKSGKEELTTHDIKMQADKEQYEQELKIINKEIEQMESALVTKFLATDVPVQPNEFPIPTPITKDPIETSIHSLEQPEENLTRKRKQEESMEEDVQNKVRKTSITETSEKSEEAVNNDIFQMFASELPGMEEYAEEGMEQDAEREELAEENSIAPPPAASPKTGENFNP